ncbi:MAG: dTDP-4-dehydrorhamnose reductase [Pelotomaculum sp. PtaB.Bin104]|nr:MAG: dTDP-4-dehydrorhamnose reductase [Pelotomaculum sp. PtaB.Bin104]
MRVLVTGAGGMLGRQVVLEYQRRGADVIYPTHAEMDITDYRQVNTAIGKARPDLVINCAAYTNVDKAEEEEDKAFLANGLGPRYLALACRQFATTLVHISTDYIFDGQASHPYQIYDIPHPINVYGASKLFGEATVREIGGNYFIARTSWLFGPGGKNFVDTILTLTRQKDELMVVNDQQGSPTYTADLAIALADLIDSKCYGTYHITNSGVTTWFELAKKVVSATGLKTMVRPCETKDFPRPADRPALSAMNPFPLKHVIGYSLPSWENAVERYVREITNGG